LEKSQSLTRDPDFLKFWVGQSISVFGAQFSPIAIGAIAWFSLRANGFQFGLLAFMNTIPFLTLGLIAGVYVDRHRRRRIMILADLGRSLTLLSIPVSALLLTITINLLYLITLVAGILTVFFEITYQSYVPSLVEKKQIVEANSKLEATRATAQFAGPTASGYAVSLLSAPIAVLGDVFGYLTSSISLLAIRRPDPLPTASQHSILHDIREGLHVVFGDRRLRAIAATTATLNLFGSAAQAMFQPYFYGNLQMTVPEVGTAFGIGSLGGVVGALAATRIARRIGVGPSVISGAVLSSFVYILVYFATPEDAFYVVAFVNFVSSIGVLIYNITQVSYRQALVPRDIQGRMNATMRTVVWGVIPLGALLGGFSSLFLGVHQTVGLMIVLGSLGFLWATFSPVRGVREFPTT
jgi:MFS family permease